MSMVKCFHSLNYEVIWHIYQSVLTGRLGRVGMQRHLNVTLPKAYIKFFEARNTQSNYKNTMNCMRKRSME